MDVRIAARIMYGLPLHEKSTIEGMNDASKSATGAEAHDRGQSDFAHCAAFRSAMVCAFNPKSFFFPLPAAPPSCSRLIPNP